jgi:predicted DNA-binding transcriptional regulator YafY
MSSWPWNWHGTQLINGFGAKPVRLRKSDRVTGTVTVHFGLSEFTEFKSWLMHFGHKAKVLEPRWLRAEIRKDLLAAARHYR